MGEKKRTPPRWQILVLANVLGFHGNGLDIWTGSWSKFHKFVSNCIVEARQREDVLLQDKPLHRSMLCVTTLGTFTRLDLATACHSPISTPLLCEVAFLMLSMI
jgi:hypothetical protein